MIVDSRANMGYPSATLRITRPESLTTFERITYGVKYWYAASAPASAAANTS